MDQLSTMNESQTSSNDGAVHIAVPRLGVPASASMLRTPDGAVCVVPARGNIPGTKDYPRVPPDPFVPASKGAVSRDRLEYFPSMHVSAHPTKWAFPAYLDNPTCRWLQALKGLYAEPISFPASLSPEAGLLLHGLVRNIRPRVVIETGTFVGVSTLWIAAALRENGDGGVVHSFDDMGPIEKGPWREVEMRSGRLEFVAGNIARAGLAEHVVLHPGNSSFEVRAAHEELRSAGGAQFAFLDADHGVLGSWHDFWATEPVLNTGGFVLLHDTFPEYCSWPGARHVLDNLNAKAVGTYEKLDMYLSPMNYGLGLIRRVG
ncbi:MAG: O-methyltransferase [Phycisphaerales bacterium]